MPAGLPFIKRYSGIPYTENPRHCAATLKGVKKYSVPPIQRRRFNCKNRAAHARVGFVGRVEIPSSCTAGRHGYGRVSRYVPQGARRLCRRSPQWDAIAGCSERRYRPPSRLPPRRNRYVLCRYYCSVGAYITVDIIFKIPPCFFLPGFRLFKIVSAFGHLLSAVNFVLPLYPIGANAFRAFIGNKVGKTAAVCRNARENAASP